MKLNNKKGMEMALQTIVLLIILIIVLIIVISFFVGEYSQGSKTVTDIGKGAIDSVIE